MKYLFNLLAACFGSAVTVSGIIDPNEYSIILTPLTVAVAVFNFGIWVKHEWPWLTLLFYSSTNKKERLVVDNVSHII